jgi:hypothetical protein
MRTPFSEPSATKLQTKRPVPNVALGTRPGENKKRYNTEEEKMQKKINREPNKRMLTVCPLGEGGITPAQAREALQGCPSHKIAESRMGRPTLKTPELCAEICRRIAEGETMQAILKDPGMPAWTTVHYWRHSDESFRQDLARAREQQAEVWAEEMLSISDDELPTHEAIGRARLRMQSRQWLAGKYNPQFADKPNQTQVNIGVQVVLPEAERVKLLERRDRALLAIQNKSGEAEIL